ncbi:MAG: GNAT family N-acetyltransferase [Eubacterium sp.]|nr:GNAT family N-acetyltransferase [Eubacterium sp.]
MTDYEYVTISPPDRDQGRRLSYDGFSLLDRVVDVEVKSTQVQGLNRYRFTISKESVSEKKEEMLAICSEAYVNDYRFYVSGERSDPDAVARMRDLIGQLEHPGTILLWVEYRENGIGFLALTSEEDAMRITLAAVLPKYQGSGVALELYTKGILVAAEAGMNRVIGRISTTNTAVMNLYSHLGAKFTSPMDVYVRKQEGK